MAFGDVTGASLARRPRAAIAVAGTRLAGVVALEVGSNNLKAPDDFHATLALADLPPAFGWAYWAAVDDVQVELFAGFLPDGAPEGSAALTRLIIGKVDRVEIDAPAMAVHLSGRDLSAPLFDNRTSETFPNQTNAQIATTLAARRGLVPVVAPTALKAGRRYERNTVRLTREVTEWDILTAAAREEGFVVYVRDGSLYFQPAALNSAAPYVLNYAPAGGAGAAGGNLVSLTLDRDLGLASGIALTLRSWNAEECQAVGTELSSGDAQRSYSCVMAGLQPGQARSFAQSQFDAISRHERRLSVTLPADTTLTPQSPLVLRGTGSAFDQTYLIDRIDRRLSFEGGFTMTVSARNVSPDGSEGG